MTATIEAFLVSHRILDPPNKLEYSWSEGLQWKTKKAKFLLCHPQYLPKGKSLFSLLCRTFFTFEILMKDGWMDELDKAH